MNKLTLNKTAIDFAFANYGADAIELAEKSIATFKGAGGTSADLPIWNQVVAQNIQQFAQASNQKLPSEIAALQKAAQVSEDPASNAGAVSTAHEVESTK